MIEEISIPDVGDGLTMSLSMSDQNHSMQIDWGGFGGLLRNNPKRSYEAYHKLRPPRPETFVLSHFHADHYKGLAYAAHRAADQNKFGFKRACYPCLPIFEDFGNRKEFALAVYAFDLRFMLTVFGDANGLPSYDFLVALDKVSSAQNISTLALHEGVQLDVDGEQFEVLWPPQKIKSEEATAPIKKARAAADEALEEDPIFRGIYYGLRERELVQRTQIGDLPEEPERERFENRERLNQISEALEGIREEIQGIAQSDEELVRNLPEETAAAGETLRQAADDLSLVFRHVENSFLFFGDLRPRRLNKISNRLEERGDTEYTFLIPAHHGTRIGKQAMSENIEADLALSSVGNLREKVEPLYSEISDLHLTTADSGDLYAGDRSFFGPLVSGFWSGAEIALEASKQPSKNTFLLIRGSD